MASESGASHVAASVAALGSIAGCIRTLLGPQGTLKLAHADSRDGVLLTGDALTVLDRLDVAHPAGTLLIEACEGLMSSHGCGITTLTCLTGELAKAALRLQQQVRAQHTHRLTGTALTHHLPACSGLWDARGDPRVATSSRSMP